MKELFSMDRKDYDPAGKVTSRPSARGIIIKEDKVLLVHSRKFDYYKFQFAGIPVGKKYRKLSSHPRAACDRRYQRMARRYQR